MPSADWATAPLLHHSQSCPRLRRSQGVSRLGGPEAPRARCTPGVATELRRTEARERLEHSHSVAVAEKREETSRVFRVDGQATWNGRVARQDGRNRPLAEPVDGARVPVPRRSPGKQPEAREAPGIYPLSRGHQRCGVELVEHDQDDGGLRPYRRRLDDRRLDIDELPYGRAEQEQRENDKGHGDKSRQEGARDPRPPVESCEARSTGGGQTQRSGAVRPAPTRHRVQEGHGYERSDEGEVESQASRSTH